MKKWIAEYTVETARSLIKERGCDFCGWKKKEECDSIPGSVSCLVIAERCGYKIKWLEELKNTTI